MKRKPYHEMTDAEKDAEVARVVRSVDRLSWVVFWVAVFAVVVACLRVVYG